MGTLRILGGPEAVATAVRRKAEAAGSVVPGDGGSLAPGEGDALVDLGSAPDEWASETELEEEERERVRRLATGIPSALRVVRLSLLGTAPDAPTALQRAHAAAEDAWRETGADLVILRHGVILGAFGLQAAWRRLLESSPVVPVPGFDARFEPLLLDDLAAYCVQAAEPGRRLDPIYDLGCGDMVTHGFWVRALARELGRSALVFPVPAFLHGSVATLLAREGMPRRSADYLLETLSRNLLPRRVNAWEHFDIRPAEVDEALTRSCGRPYAAPPSKPDEPFGAWRRTRRKRPRPFLR